MDPRRLLPVLAVVAAACVVATILVGVARPDQDPATPRRPAAPSSPASGSASGPARGPAAVLARWDARRAAAWAAGDVDLLGSLYAAGSRTGAADVRLLRHYLARGLRVEGLATQVLALDVVEESPRRLVLDVTDRLVGGSAVGGETPIALPADRASMRRLVLVRPGERWVVARAWDRRRGQASAAASTSRTSSSSKS